MSRLSAGAARQVTLAVLRPLSGADPFPARIEAQTDPNLNRWKWLVKWFLVIPHVIVLLFLWVAFALLTVVAGLAILFTGRYPRSIFEFNVGVMRWTWRVMAYASNPLCTDAYPPFTLAETADAARLSVVYPEKLSRGLVLVKWWLLAIPHYLIVGLVTSGVFFVGSGVPKPTIRFIRSSRGNVCCSSKKASPSPGVCQIFAKACHS